MTNEQVFILLALIMVCLIGPMWNISFSLAALLDAKKDRIECDTIDYARTNGIALPKSIRKKAV